MGSEDALSPSSDLHFDRINPISYFISIAFELGEEFNPPTTDGSPKNRPKFFRKAPLIGISIYMKILIQILTLDLYQNQIQHVIGKINGIHIIFSQFLSFFSTEMFFSKFPIPLLHNGRCYM